MRSITLNFADWLEAIFWHSFWYMFWHSFWHIFWYIFCFSFWHIFWHIFWYSFWHLSDISFDILSDISSGISSDILSDVSFDSFFLTYLLTFFLTYLSPFFLTCFLTHLLTFFLTYQNQNLTSTVSQKKSSAISIFASHHATKVISMTTLCLSSVIALTASDRPAKRQLSPKMQNACSSTHTHTHTHHMHQTVPPKSSWVQEMQSWQWCRNYISWRVQTMKPDACHCGSFASSV